MLRSRILGIAPRAPIMLLVLMALVLQACQATASPSADDGSPPSNAPVGSEPPPTDDAGGTLARVQDEGTAVVGFINETPFSFVSDAGTVTGVQPEVIRAFMAAEGVETIEGLLADFAAQIPALIAGRTDMIGAAMFIRPERCTQIAFGNPDLQVGSALIVQPGNPLDLQSFADVAENDEAIAGSITGGQETILAEVAGIPEDRHVLFPDVTAELAAFESGRVNVLIGPSLSLRGLIDQNPNLGGEYVALSEQPLDQDGNPAVGYTGVGFRQEDAEMREAYNDFLAEARESGQLVEIVQAFGLGEEDLAPADLTADELCQE